MNENELKRKVKDLINSNIKEGYSEHLESHYCYIMPSPGNYPFQWFWDTCFHIFILCRLKEYDLAKKNLESLFVMQEDSGFVGHMIFWESTLPQNKLNILQAKPTLGQLRPHMSAIIQPPFIAQALERIYEETGDESFLDEMLPKIEKYHKWLKDNRDFDGDGLITIITSFESGMDWKPSYDQVVGFKGGLANDKLYWKIISVDTRNFINRYDLEKIYDKGYFLVKDAGFNSIYGLDLLALSRLTKNKTWKKRASLVTQNLLDKCYDKKDNAFYDLAGKDDKRLKVLTPTIFYPLVLKEIRRTTAEIVINRHLLSSKQFDVPFPIPSVAVNEKSFNSHESKFLWRGPTWIMSNWFLYRCFLEQGLDNHAKNFKDTVLKLIKKSGFREYYNPFSGEGYGAKQFTWSGLVLDMLNTSLLT